MDKVLEERESSDTENGTFFKSQAFSDQYCAGFGVLI